MSVTFTETPPLKRPERIRTAACFYDYAGQDPINNYDLSGEMPIPPNPCITQHKCSGSISISLASISTWAGRVAAVSAGVAIVCPACAFIAAPIAGIATGVMVVADAGNFARHPSAATATTGIIDATGVTGGAAIEHALAGSVSKQVSRATGAAGGTLITLLQGQAATVKPAPKQTGRRSQPVLRGR